MGQPLHVAVLAAAAWAVGALAFAWLRTRGFGGRVLFARAAGDPAAGVRYSFTTAMLPQAKESVMMHLPSYAAGMIFHLGTFVAFALLAVTLARIQLPLPVAWIARVVTLAGSFGGLALLAKRALTPHLRGLSSPDDFVANLLTTTFAALAGAASLCPPIETPWLVVAAVLLVYVPIGKIRHCFFFFSSRAYLGAFFGYRGTFPSPGWGERR
ncbi:MAG TPA: hypothetical protein PLS53_07060 [Thermoanaerobaculaceae bacterium]|nr:hypothetical protein [Thermoanaerobaculaceae bacterium]HPS77895.1 hypothetical protein [Thermoanaerobaculaceae bacterium]